ncbi:hypothetical protein FB451DRAFT_1246310 [Mycena latifolia]|nr:hypothetical protein FB451DRAFT_1246310 [Mycena latifolia]
MPPQLPHTVYTLFFCMHRVLLHVPLARASSKCYSMFPLKLKFLFVAYPCSYILLFHVYAPVGPWPLLEFFHRYCSTGMEQTPRE